MRCTFSFSKLCIYKYCCRIIYLFLCLADSVDITDEKGLTGLMWASAYGQLGSARQLLKRGASINRCGPKLQTSLHLAAAYGHHDVVKLLLNHGADPNVCDEVRTLHFLYLNILSSIMCHIIIFLT